MNESIFKTTPCKGCGRPILWAQDDKGGRIPLDPSAPVYHLVAQDVHGGWRACRDSTARVSHFSTCPKASDFSGKNRAKTDDTKTWLLEGNSNEQDADR